MEESVKSITGTEPRCWHAPEYEIEEEEIVQTTDFSNN